MNAILTNVEQVELVHETRSMPSSFHEAVLCKILTAIAEPSHRVVLCRELTGECIWRSHRCWGPGELEWSTRHSRLEVAVYHRRNHHGWSLSHLNVSISLLACMFDFLTTLSPTDSCSPTILPQPNGSTKRNRHTHNGDLSTTLAKPTR